MSLNGNFVCDLCGSVEYRSFFSAPAMHLSQDELSRLKYYQYVECAGCGLVSQFPQAAARSVAPLYAKDSYHEMRGVIGDLLDRAMSLYYMLARPLPEGNGRKLIDIGAGSGKFLSYAKRRGWQVLGTECSETAAKIALEKREVAIISDSMMASLPTGSFDIVTMYHVLEHVDSPRALMGEVHRLLRGDGVCVIQIPVLDSLDYAIWRKDSVWIGAPQHKTMFTGVTLRRMAEKAGFTVEKVSNDFISPQLLTWSILYSIDRMTGRYTSMEFKKLISLLMLPVHLPAAVLAAAFDRSPFKTYYLKKA